MRLFKIKIIAFWVLEIDFLPQHNWSAICFLIYLPKAATHTKTILMGK